ncbi:MAG: asparaginase [Alphaproteobacteria bacterium]|nr:asparaginase [Alphaproteobacteria bacterium]
MESVHVIITGGTIDSSYSPAEETARPNEYTVIPTYLMEKIKPYPALSFETICMLDSGDITDGIRNQIAEAIRKSQSRKIVITHGTNTMQKTAEYLAALPDVVQKTVILTGAMIPIKEFAMSDGGFNLGFALAEALSRPAGVYVCMNACTFPAGCVTKNFAAGRFEGLSS